MPLLAVTFFTFVKKLGEERDPERMRELLHNEKRIIHARGFIADSDGTKYSYTNSYEAFENSYLSGNRICELDFAITKDKKVVCCRSDYSDGNNWADGTTFSRAPSHEEFMSVKFDGKFTMMDLDTVADFMRKHDDLYVVTDIKYDLETLCQTISEKYGDIQNQFIIQIYTRDEYRKVKDMNFKYLIYTLYRETDAVPEEISAFCAGNDLLCYTFPENYTRDLPDIFEELKNTGVPLCVHTVNDIPTFKTYFDMGITGVYTDETDFEQN